MKKGYRFGGNPLEPHLHHLKAGQHFSVSDPLTRGAGFMFNFKNLLSAFALPLFVSTLMSGCKSSDLRAQATQASPSDAQLTVNTNSEMATSAPLPSTQLTAKITALNGILTGLDDLYSIATTSAEPGLIWMGGWLTAADASFGDDRLYQGNYNGAQITGLTPLNFSNPGYTPGYIPGYHTNDPSVITSPVQPSWLFMYYTMLPNAYQADPVGMFLHNFTGFAASFDGGASWFNSGVIIGQSNGYDNNAAWAPSAVVVNGQISLYYNTSAPIILRSLINSNGWQLESTQPVLMNGQPLSGLVNVDVAYAYGSYWLAANNAADGLKSIVLYLSSDGINFTPFNGTDGILINGGAVELFTPRIVVTGSNTFNLFFSEGANSSARSADVWSFELISPEAPAPSETRYAMGAAASNDVLSSAWSASNVIDGNIGTAYSSGNSPSSQNSHGSYLAVWLQSSQNVNTVNLTARMYNGRVEAFPASYTIYLTLPDNSNWMSLGDFTAQPDGNGNVTLSLGNTYSTYGVLIVPTALGADTYGNYYFQMAEVGLGLM